MNRNAVRLTQLERNHCRWVHGDPAKIETHAYCGREVVPTTSWCIKHLRKVTPHAETIIRRELTRWNDLQNGIVAEVVIARKMTETESLRSDKERTKDVIEELKGQ